MVILDLEADRLQDAEVHLEESLQLHARTGSWLDLCEDLDHCGLLCAATGRHAEAATVWAAMTAYKRHDKIHDPPLDARRREKRLRQARRALGPARTRVAEERGAAMSLNTAAEYALMLTDLRPPRSAPGPGTLSPRERGAGHPGRPGPHQRPDRRPAVHQRPHSGLALGPDPGRPAAAAAPT